MTVDKKIKKFLNDIKFKVEFLKNMYDWEYDFLISAGKSHGIDPEDLTNFIQNYKRKSVRKKRIVKKVIDDAGKVYPSLSVYAKEKGIGINKATYWVRKHPERVQYLEVV